MKLIICSPEKVIFQGDVELVELPGTKGRFTVLTDHDALITTLQAGNIRYQQQGDEQLLPIQSGYAEVLHNTISVCIYLS